MKIKKPDSKEILLWLCGKHREHMKMGILGKMLTIEQKSGSLDKQINESYCRENV